MNIVTAEFPVIARYLVPLKYKYPPQYPFLEHPQAYLLPPVSRLFRNM